MHDTYTQWLPQKIVNGVVLTGWHIEGKQTLIMSMTDDENNHFPIGSMVVKGEYLTHDNNARKKGGYVYRDYKIGASVYHFTNVEIEPSDRLILLTTINN